MFQSGIPFHETGSFQSHRTFLPDDQYGIALDNLVKGCTDILLVSPSGTHIFLGKRCVQPQPDWWFMGGRMFPGETPIESGQRLLKRELGLEMDSCRFRPVCAQAFAFAMREQEPKEHGTTDVQFCFRVDLEKEQDVTNLVVDPNEYCDSEWKLPKEILEGNYHPALKYAVSCMLTTETFEKLKECEARGGDNEELAKLARELLGKTNDADQILKRNDYKLVSTELQYETVVTTKYQC